MPTDEKHRVADRLCAGVHRHQEDLHEHVESMMLAMATIGLAEEVARQSNRADRPALRTPCNSEHECGQQVEQDHKLRLKRTLPQKNPLCESSRVMASVRSAFHFAMAFTSASSGRCRNTASIILNP